MDAASIVQIAVSALAMGGIYALIAEGFYIAHRITNTVNFGQGDFFDARVLCYPDVHSFQSPVLRGFLVGDPCFGWCWDHI